jgi:protoporphyrinogen oxidase
MNTAIIGAGASGLSLALMLDGDVTIFERSERTGGHCHATIRDGWTFDRGPHIMFSRDKDVLDFMIASLGDNVHQSRRNNRVFVDGRMVKYPLENDLASLTLETRTRCLLDYLFNDHSALAESPSNLDEWFVGNFGQGMTDLYFRPSNEKIWNVALRDLSMSWSERIPSPPPEDVVKGSLGVATEGYLHQLNYHYPLVGGYQAITDAWTTLVPRGSLRLNSTVTSVVKSGQGIDLTTAVGTEHFDRVVSTAPMASLLTMVNDVPASIRDAVASLRVNPIDVITLGYRGDDRNKFTAVYFADESYLPNRVSSPSVFSPRNAPDGCFSLQAEITFPPGDDYLKIGDDELVAHVHEGFVSSGLVEPDCERVFCDVQRLEFAYVVYTNGYEDAVALVREWAQNVGITIHGRFGSFDYLNVDGCVRRSQELASELNGRVTPLPSVA